MLHTADMEIRGQHEEGSFTLYLWISETESSSSGLVINAFTHQLYLADLWISLLPDSTVKIYWNHKLRP